MKCGMRGTRSCLCPLTTSSKIFLSLGFLESMGMVVVGRGLSKPLICIYQSVAECGKRAAHVVFVRNPEKSVGPTDLRFN